ncbi:MAG: hypothetical protein DVB28_002078, partial [Verrucomicrobia bacterium]
MALFLVVALTLTGPVPQVALAANVYSLVQNSATGVTTSATGTVSVGTLVISPGTFSAITDSKFSLTPSVAGGTLSVQNLLFDGTYSLTIAAKLTLTGGTVYTVPSSGGTLLSGGSVALAAGLEPGMNIALSTSLSKTGTVSTVNPTGFTTRAKIDGTTITLALLTATKAGLFDGVTADLSTISVLKLAAGGTLDLGKGL